MIWIIVSIVVILGITGLFRRKRFDGETDEQIRHRQEMQTRSWW